MLKETQARKHVAVKPEAEKLEGLASEAVKPKAGKLISAVRKRLRRLEC